MCLESEDNSLGGGIVSSATNLPHHVDHAFVNRTIGFRSELLGVDQAEPYNRIGRTIRSGRGSRTAGVIATSRIRVRRGNATGAARKVLRLLDDVRRRRVEGGGAGHASCGTSRHRRSVREDRDRPPVAHGSRLMRAHSIEGRHRNRVTRLR